MFNDYCMSILFVVDHAEAVHDIVEAKEVIAAAVEAVLLDIGVDSDVAIMLCYTKGWVW